MAGRGTADILFLVDASRSMEPCIEGLKHHVASFVEVFKADANRTWDLRFDFIAHDDTLVEDRAAGVDRDFRERVVRAGGRYDDVDVRATLVWNDRNDLDLHVVAPSGEEIYFRNRDSACGGELDVDRNVSGETTQPVENIRWARGKAPRGSFRVFVRNFSYHEDREGPVHFRVEVVNGGALKHFDLTISPQGETGNASDKAVCSFTFDPANRAAPSAEADGVFRARSIFEPHLLPALYRRQGNFFTADINAFQRALGEVRTGDNEAPLVALDCALDFPWRNTEGCHRVVVMLTDEPLEGGNRRAESLRLLPTLINKLHAQKVMLFLISPESEGFETLSGADRCEWHVVEGHDGLRSVDFKKLLEAIAKSVSVSQTNGTSLPVQRALFGQNGWA